MTDKPRSARNTILHRVWASDGLFYLRMANGELITPATAVKRGLFTQQQLIEALKEEQQDVKSTPLNRG